MQNEQTPDTGGNAAADNTPADDGGQGDMFAGFDFGSMDFADSDTSAEPPAPEKSEPSSPETVTPQEQKPVEPVGTPPAQAAPAPVAPTAPPATETPAMATPQPPVAPQPDTTAAQLEEHRNRALAELEKYYALDDKAAERFEIEPMKVLSELAARLHLAVVQNAYGAVLQQLPQLTHATVDAIGSYKAAEDKFYQSWPVFSRENPEHAKVLQTYGQLFRQQNPQATAEEFTKYVGAAAAAHLGLKMPASKSARKSVPHTPAAAGGGTAPASGAEPKPTQIEDMFNAYVSGQA